MKFVVLMASAIEIFRLQSENPKGVEFRLFEPIRSGNAFDQCFMHDDKFVRGAEFGELWPNVLQEHEQVTQAHVADAKMNHFGRWVG